MICSRILQRLPSVLPAVMLVSVLVWIAGCQTTGYKKADAAAWHSEVAAKQVQVVSSTLDATTGSLNALVNRPEPDAEPQFLKFSETLAQLKDSARSAGKEVDRLWSDGTRYFEVWDKEIATIQDAGTRSVSENRKLQVSNQFDDTIRRYETAEENLQLLIAYLEDLRKALSTDLTSGGLAAMNQSVTEADTRARKVQQGLTQSANDFESLSARIASYRVQETR